MTNTDTTDHRRRCSEALRLAGVVLSQDEAERVEITDFGLGEFATQGLALLTYVNTDRYCAKELVLLADQTCPQHRHPAFGGQSGKEETFRCRAGFVRLFVAGDPTSPNGIRLPEGSEQWYTVWHEVTLQPGEQHTIPPDTWHWFQAGPDGAVVSEFSSASRDDLDLFSDPRVVRVASEVSRT